MKQAPTISKDRMLEKFHTMTGRVVWADLEKPDRYNKYGITITVDLKSHDWASFKRMYMSQVEDGDLATAPEDALKNLGQWGCTMLNDVDECTDEPRWFEGDVVIKFKSNKCPRICDRTIKCGDEVIVGYDMKHYSFTNDEGVDLEGVSLYLNGAIKA